VTTITDNESATLSIAATAGVTEQGGAQDVGVTLTLAGTGTGPMQLAHDVSVNVKLLPGSATLNRDFVFGGPRTLTFSAGSGNSTRTVTVVVLNDAKPEGPETINLGLDALADGTGGQVRLAAPAAHRMTILANDRALPPAGLRLAGRVIVVPGQPGQRVRLTITLPAPQAQFNNELGVFVVGAGNAVGGVLPGRPGYVRAALSSPSRRVIAAANNRGPMQTTLTFTAGQRLALYLVQNGTAAQARAGGAHVLFAFVGANFDGVDHARAAQQSRNLVGFVFEDLTGGGDHDFNDRIVYVTRAR
jgi:hypothetical protein